MTAKGNDDAAAERRDEILKRMLNTPPKPRPKSQPGAKRGRPTKAADASSASD